MIFRGRLHRRPMIGRVLSLLTFPIATMTAMSEGAWASAGCDAVNAGAFNFSIVADPTSSLVASRRRQIFMPGEVLSFTITRVNPSPSDGAYLAVYDFNNDNRPLASWFGIATSEQANFSVTSTATKLYPSLGSLGSSISISVTCTPPGPTNSQKLRSLQIQGSKIVAQSSGQAIAGAVDQAIGSALDGGVNPNTSGGGTTAGTNGAPSTLGGPVASPLGGPRPEGDTRAPSGPVTLATMQNGWQAWANLRFAETSRKPNFGGFDGQQVNGTAGIGRLIAPGLVVGAFTGIEGFTYDVASLSGRLKGNGATGGAYLGWKLSPTLRYDLAGGYSHINYDASAGPATGSFAGNRWLLSSGLTGSHSVSGMVIEPSARVFALWERQGAFVDSLGAAQDINSFSVGRASLGARALMPIEDGALTWTPYAGLFADRNFSRGGAAVAAGTEVLTLSDGWSARAVGGIGLGSNSAGTVSIGGEWGGIGTDTRQRSLTVRGALPF